MTTSASSIQYYLHFLFFQCYILYKCGGTGISDFYLNTICDMSRTMLHIIICDISHVMSHIQYVICHIEYHILYATYNMWLLTLRGFCRRNVSDWNVACLSNILLYHFFTPMSIVILHKNFFPKLWNFTNCNY